MQDLFVTLCIGGGVVGVALRLFFARSKDLTLKRRVHRLVILLLSLPFIVVPLWHGLSPSVLVIVVPFVVLFTVVNLRFIRFCPSCGATLSDRTLFNRYDNCPRCGARLRR